MGPRQKMLMHVAWSGLLASGLLVSVLPVAAQQTVAVPSSDSANLPDSPGMTVSRPGNRLPQQNTTGELWAASRSAPESGQSQPQTAQPPSAQSQSSQPQSDKNQTQVAPQKPVGTAAAEAPNASGIAASQPAGVAIAPAKQRRVRTIVLRTGAIIGAGVAVGTVLALTAGTSSKPPGAR